MRANRGMPKGFDRVEKGTSNNAGDEREGAHGKPPPKMKAWS